MTFNVSTKHVRSSFTCVSSLLIYTVMLKWTYFSNIKFTALIVKNDTSIMINGYMYTKVVFDLEIRKVAFAKSIKYHIIYEPARCTIVLHEMGAANDVLCLYTICTNILKANIINNQRQCFLLADSYTIRPVLSYSDAKIADGNISCSRHRVLICRSTPLDLTHRI